ncbi:MAG TPA: diacylglycerol kinase family protein [Candidatus Acidoferrum sp.]|jgi:diacylglycerol kinase (ATP)|nr:diacylglycerol kinase family protein [Candidatus Acidoferrum sp.]
MSQTARRRNTKTAKRSAPKASPKRATSLLILSSKAGSMTPEIEAKLRQSFPSSLVVEFDPRMDIESIMSPKATVIVAGGDGTIGWVVRRLADTRHPLGILSLGTFNNFAKSLHLPTQVGPAIRVIQTGRARAITLGRVNGRIFLEAAAIGLFGHFITAGESAKDRAFGQFADDLKNIAAAKPFTYELTGDIRGSGTAMSLVFTNTTSIGAQMPVSDKTPVDPYLELSVHAGATRTDIAKRVLARVVLSKHKEGGLGQVFKFRKLMVTTKPRVKIYADNSKIGPTPATITAELSALRVILAR